MNYLHDKSVYLSGAMSVYVDNGCAWRDWIKPILKEKYGLTVYDPTHKILRSASEIGENKDEFRDLIMNENFLELKKKFAPVCRWDLRSVDKSDFIIVDYDPFVHSVGTWHEVVVASWQRKPILLKYDRKGLNKFNPWLSVLIPPEHLFHDWNDMFKYLEKVNNNEFDESLWTL